MDDRIADRWYDAVAAPACPPATSVSTALAAAGQVPAAPSPRPADPSLEVALVEALAALPPAGSDAAAATVRAELNELVSVLLGALAVEPVDRETSHAVGARLVGIGLAGADDLASTVEVVGPALFAAAGPDRAPAAFAVLGAVVGGHGDAARDRASATSGEPASGALAAPSLAADVGQLGEVEFRAVFEHSGLGTLVVAESGTILAANEAARRIVGRELTELSIGDVWDAVDPRDRPGLIDMWAAARAGRPGEGVWRFGHPSGPRESPVWVSLTASMIDDATVADIVYFAVTVEDVTARRAQLAETFDSAGDPVAARTGKAVLAAAQEAAARTRLVQSIEAAMRADQFVVHYQPIVRLRDHTIIGAEALARWEHPRYGLVGPEQFIGVAEESGLIVQLGLRVLETACRDAVRWLATGGPEATDDPGIPSFVSVNISARQLDEPDLVPAVLDILRQTGLEPQHLQLELVESLVVASAGRPLAALRELAAAGIRIALDDFGTGYSNFAYLHTLPIGALKLAGEFCGLPDPAGLGNSAARVAEQAETIKGVVSIAHALGHTVTVEAVETPEQAARMRGLGADLGQGHLFGRPMCLDKMIAAFAAGRAGPYGSADGPCAGGGPGSVSTEALSRGQHLPVGPARGGR